MMLYGKVGDRKCVLKNDHYDYGWMLSYNGTKDFKPVDELLNLTDEQMEKFTNFFDTYDFTGIINAMKIAERKHVVDDRRERFVGKKIVDIIKKGSSFVVVLDDGSQFPCGDFLGFRGNIGSAFRKK
jgi:hypothetical protein